MTNSIDLIPPPFKIGKIAIQQVVEMQAPFFKIGDFLPTSDSDKVNALKPQFEPWALCPETGKLVLAVQTYVVRTSRHTILIDTCVGCDKFSGIPDWHMRSDNSWLSRMASVGVAPESVDYVFCTHMHGDHVGWNTLLRDGRYVPTFPNAKYIFAQQEIDFQSTRTEESRKRCYQQSILPVLEAGQAQLVDSDFALDDEVWLVPTPGHTPGHVAVHLNSAGMEAVMIGDAMHSPRVVGQAGFRSNSCCTNSCIFDRNLRCSRPSCFNVPLSFTINWKINRSQLWIWIYFWHLAYGWRIEQRQNRNIGQLLLGALTGELDVTALFDRKQSKQLVSM